MFCGRTISAEGELSYINIISISKDGAGTSYGGSATLPIRPVFTLKPEAKVISGDGTQSNPYVIK